MSLGAGRRADRVNRAVLSVLGVLMLIGGAVGLAFSLGAFGQDRSDWPLRPPTGSLARGQCQMVLDRGHRSCVCSSPPARCAGCCSRPSHSERRRLLVPLPDGEGKTSISARAVVDAVVADLPSSPVCGRPAPGCASRTRWWSTPGSTTTAPATCRRFARACRSRSSPASEVPRDRRGGRHLELRLVSGANGRVE